MSTSAMMEGTGDSFDRALAVFGELCDLPPEEQRERLAKIEEEDAALASEVRELVRGDRDADERLDQGAVEQLSFASAAELRGEIDTFTTETMERLGNHQGSFGRYEIQGELARGGQGAILRVRDELLDRNLAMKIILGQGQAEPTGETPEVETKTLGRFLEEAHVTGKLDHPGIVPVHDLGLDSQGRAYFTMKLVQGKTLMEVFDELAAGKGEWTQTRVLGLLLKVCEALSYAHAKGVIHRDLKPANVMVGRYGEVYVMDWGLAKIPGRADEKDLRVRPELALSTSEVRSERHDHAGEMPDSPLYTMDGDVVGTPAYMSPEQAAGRVSEMGPPSDVYALGAMLYHLIAGHMPYVPPGARLNNYAVWSHVQAGPPGPLEEKAPGAPAELVALCEKAMARQVQDRYADMTALAEDLSAYVEGRVVHAYETGAVAEFRKWVARNKPLAMASAAAVLALVGGLATSSSLYVEAKDKAEEASDNALQAQANELEMREERDRADSNAEEAERQADLARAEAERATQEEATTERVLEFLTGMFEEQDPSQSRGATITVKEVLDRNAARIEQALGDEPEIKARLMQSMGELYLSLGLYREAEPLLEGALSSQRAVLGDDHPDTLDSMNHLAQLYLHQGRYAEAEPLVVQAFEKHNAVLGEDHPDTLGSLNNLAALYRRQGRYEEAEPLWLQALEKRRAVLGEDHPDTLRSLNNLGRLYTDQGRHAEAEPLLVQALEKRRAVLGEDHPDTLGSLTSLAVLYERQGRYAEAEPLYVQAPEKQPAALGEHHPDTLISLNNPSKLYRDWLSSRREALGESHLDTLTTQSNLGVVLWTGGFHGEAEPLLLECLAKRTEVLGEDHPDTLASLYHVARLHESLQRWEEAELAAGTLLELTPEDAEEYAEREQLLQRVLEALGDGE